MTLRIFSAVKRPIFGGFLVFSGLNFLLFGDLFRPGNNQILSSSQADLFFHFIAWRQFAFDQLRHGYLPLWNPNYLCGAPFFGGFEAALLYPPNWLNMFLPLDLAINLGIIFHIILAGFFTYLWSLRRGLHPLGAFLAGVIFMWGGAYYLHLFAGHLPNLCTMVWAPLIFLCVDGLDENNFLKWVLLGIFAVSMQILAGHPQYVYFTAIIVWIYGFISLKGLKNKRRFVTSLTALYLGAFLLTAIQLWTGIEAFKECGRNIPLEIGSASSFSFPPENILTLFLPDFFGNLTTNSYWGQWYLWEVSLYIGVVAFFLIIFCLVKGPSSQKWRLFVVAGIAFFLSLGAFTPFYKLLYDFAPFFKSFRGICKFDFLTSLLLAVLAGTGMDQVYRQKTTPQWAWKFLLSICFLLLILGLFIFLSIQDSVSGYWSRWFTSVHWLQKAIVTMALPQRRSYVMESGLGSARALWLGGGIFLLLALLMALLRDNKQKAYALTTLCVLEMFIFAKSNRPTFDLSILQNKFKAVADFKSKNPGDYRVYGTGSASLVTGVEDIWEDEPMVLSRYGRFVCRSQNLTENQLFSVVPIFQKFPSALGMLRLKYRIFFNEDPIRIAAFPFKRLPRMQLLSNWIIMPDEREELDKIFGNSFDPSRQVLLEEAPTPLPATGEGAGTLVCKDLSTDEIEITADLPRPELLVLTDNYSEGWHAKAFRDSGQSHYQVIPADYFLRAIPLFKGHNHLLLEYRPTAFVVGKWVSIISCILYVVILLIGLKRNPIFLKAGP